MSHTLKSQLAFFSIFSIYIIIRFIGISDISLNVFQQIYLGNILKDTILLIALFLLSYTFFNQARNNTKLGPTIIKGSKLKFSLCIFLGLGWLAVIAHLIFDSIKIFLPFEWLSIYKFADLLDETISHVFMYLSAIGLFFVMSMLEIERPLAKKIKNKEITIIIFISLIAGIFWGLNLSEGRLSLITSLPAMIIYLVITVWFLKKYKLSLAIRPWTLMYIIISLFGSITFIIWALIFKSIPEFFNYLK
ncbi:MAG: hypothetical protein ABII08_01540 [Candidatus Beckwithbacteria bacterium]